MAFALTIAAASKDLQAGSLHISKTANGRATASFDVVSDGTYRPAIDSEVIMTLGGTRIFAGLTTHPKEVGLFGKGGRAEITTSISAVDFNAYTERRFVNETLAAGTLKSMLTTLVANYLTGYGVTLDAGQVNGPSIPEITYEYTQLSEVLNAFATITADAGEPYVWRIDAFKVLRMFQPSTQAAPFNITSNTPTQVVGDIEVEINREHYANKIILKVPTRTELNRVESFTADGVEDTWDLSYALTKHNGFVFNSATGNNETLTTVGSGFDLAVFWLYDQTANTIQRVEQGVSNPPAAGTVSITFDGTFTGQAIASDAGEIAAHGIWERVVTVDSVPTDTTAQALADGELAKSIYENKLISYSTREAGVEPGQTQTFTVTRRNLSATAVITDVVIRDFGKNELLSKITATADGAQTNLGRGFRDELKLWRGDKTGGAVKIAPSAVVGTGVAPSIGAAPPDTAVQYNKGGGFGAVYEFRFDEDTHSLVVGEGSSITAALFSHCVILGENCEIGD